MFIKLLSLLLDIITRIVSFSFYIVILILLTIGATVIINPPSLTSESKERIISLFEMVKTNQERIEEPTDIGSKNISELDKASGITTTEMSFGKRVIEKVRGLFKRKENNSR